MLRLFAGFFTTRRLQEVLETIRSQSNHHLRGKWVEPENLHLTFQFFGEVESSRVVELLKNLQEVSSNVKPIKVKYIGLGVFPSVDRARVLWIGIGDGYKALKDLTKQLVKVNKKSGFDDGSKIFHPHVTICRINSYDKAFLQELLNTYENRYFGEDVVDKIALIKSSLNPIGPVYSVLEEFSLGR
ncbi:MAG: RNA 2',3'-cyclic phosphodiesterase [Aquificaceae bacterium]